MNLFYLLLSLCLLGTPKPKAPIKIAVRYFSSIDKSLTNELLKNITSTYNCTVFEIDGVASLPVAAYYKPRNRYRANIILDYLNKI